jgi:hypothetical protein
MAQYNVIVTVVDPDGLKHYATMPDMAEVTHPAYGGLWTIGCSQVATGWESGDRLENFYQAVTGMRDMCSKLKSEFVRRDFRKIAEVIEKFANNLLPMLNYHSGICKKCMEALNDESEVG